MDCSLPWNSPGMHTRVGSPSLLQENLPAPGVESRSPALQADSLLSEPQGSWGKSLILEKKNCFVLLCWVLVAAHGIFNLPCRRRDFLLRLENS